MGDMQGAYMRIAHSNGRQFVRGSPRRPLGLRLASPDPVAGVAGASTMTRK